MNILKKLLTVCLLTGTFAMTSYADEVSNTVSFVTEHHVWDTNDLTDQQKVILKDMITNCNSQGRVYSYSEARRMFGTTSIHKILEIASEPIYLAGAYSSYECGRAVMSSSASSDGSEIRILFPDYSGDTYPNADVVFTECWSEVGKIVRDECGVVEGEDVISASNKIYNWLATNMLYDSNYHYSNVAKALKDRRGVCWHMAELYELMCDYCSIPCGTLETEDGQHILNTQIINGATYYTDVTAGIANWRNTYFMSDRLLSDYNSMKSRYFSMYGGQ